MLTRERLFEVMSYDPSTGEFRWLSLPKHMHRKLGCIPGKINHRGYWKMYVDGKTYQGHRLAWLYMTGDWPSLLIDHIDGDPSNNKWANLRLATPAQNCQNRRASVRNTSGYKGVTWHRKCQKWQASIKVNGKNIHLGLHSTPEAAKAAHDAKALEVFGEFARVGA